MVLDHEFRVVQRILSSSSQAVRADAVEPGRMPLRDIHPEDLPAAMEALARLAGRPGSTDTFHLRVENGNGGWQFALVVATNCRDDPSIDGLVVRVHLSDDSLPLPSSHVERTPIVDIAPCGIDVRDGHGNVLFTNSWLEARCPGRAGAVDWLDVVRDRPAGEALVRSALAGTSSGTDLSVDVDNRSSWFRIRAEPHRDSSGDVIGVVTTVVDATAEVEARQRLERREQMLSATFAALDQGVLIIDEHSIVTHANAAAHRHLGEPAGTLVGTRLGDSLFDRVLEADDERLPTQVDNAATRAMTTGDEVTGRVIRYAHPDGRDRWFATSTRALAATSVESDAAVATIADITERHERSLVHEHEARHDPLTGLPNRAAMIEHLTGALARQRRHGTGTCGVLFCDLDDFKSVNDTLGHAAGDRVLVVIADRIRAACRAGDRVGRFGGDEFLVVLEDLDHPTETDQIAERLISALQSPVLVGDRTWSIGISVGVAVHSSDADGAADDLIEIADDALYEAKRAGRGTWRTGRPPESGSAAAT